MLLNKISIDLHIIILFSSSVKLISKKKKKNLRFTIGKEKYIKINYFIYNYYSQKYF